jgi:hypothetical protein
LANVCVQALAPFTDAEAPEVVGVSFFNNMINRVTLTQLTTNETLPMMSVFRPFIQRFPALNGAMHRNLMKPGSSATPASGAAAACRPHSHHPLQRCFAWAAGEPQIAKTVAYLDYVVNYHLRGRFLPLDLWCAPLHRRAMLACHVSSAGISDACSAGCFAWALCSSMPPVPCAVACKRGFAAACSQRPLP